MVEPVPDIAESLSQDWLAQMANNPEVLQLIKDINQEYLYWDKVKYKAPKNIAPEQFWHIIRLTRMLNAKGIRFGKYRFSLTITEPMMALLNIFDMNMGGVLGTQSIVPEKDRRVYLINSIMEEAIASSRMEGATTTRKVAKEMLRAQKKPTNKSQQMIVNNYRTISYLSDHKEEEFSIENIKKIHRFITANTLDSEADEGQFRTDDRIVVQNAITGEVVHTPPRHEEIEELLQEVCEFANQEDMNEFIHPIVKAIIIHFMLSYIHPFVDGNGRTARSLFYWYLLKKGYWLVEYLSISRIIYKSKSQYEKAFLYTEADGLDVSYFVQYNLRAMQTAYTELSNYLSRKVKEQHALTRYVGVANINERQAKVLQVFCDKPDYIMSVREMASRFAVSPVTARGDLKNLVQTGLLEEIAMNKKLTAYRAVPDLAERLQKLENKKK